MKHPLILPMLAMAGIALVFLSAVTEAQEYPTKSLRAIVPNAPGGGVDIATRTIGQKLTERWGQQVIVDNRAGGNTTIGTELASRAAPDGYTLLMISSSFAINFSLLPKLTFQPKDFASVIMVAPTYYLLVTHPSVPASSVRDIIQLAKGGNYKLVVAASGPASPGYLSGEMLKMMTGIDFVHVPYKGTGPAIADVVAGHANMMFGDVLAALPHVNAGRLKLLGVSPQKRLPKLPNTPTLAETGVPGYDSMSWTGMFAPAGTPRPIIDKLNAEVKSILRLPDVQERLGTDPSDFGSNTPDYAAAFLKSEIAKWAKVIKASGVRLD